MNQQTEKAGIHNMDLQKTRILDLILLLTFSLILRKLHPSQLWSMGYLFGLFSQTISEQLFLSEMTSNHLCANELVLHLSECHVLGNLGRIDDRKTPRYLFILSIRRLGIEYRYCRRQFYQCEHSSIVTGIQESVPLISSLWDLHPFVFCFVFIPALSSNPSFQQR